MVTCAKCSKVLVSPATMKRGLVVLVVALLAMCVDGKIYWKHHPKGTCDPHLEGCVGLMRRSGPPRPGPAAGSGVQGETLTLVGPMTPRIITNRKQQIKYPYYSIRDT